MIETLRISNLAIVEAAELEFGPGLNVLTGETGAGKSIVLGALGLLAGARAAGHAPRDEAEPAVVEAVFRTERHADLESGLEARGLGVEDHELIVRRTLNPAGRSRAQVSGQLVPATTLAELFAGRLEISSQHDSQALLRAEVHGQLLDRKGELLPVRRAVAEGCAGLREIDVEIERLRAETRDREQRRDFLAFQVREIDEAKLVADEVEDLLTARSRLAHAERFRVDGGAALARMAGDPGSGEGAAADALADAAKRLEDLAALDPVLAELAERVSAAAAETREAATDLERHLDGIEADPARLSGLEERLHQIEQLQRKYGATVSDVLTYRDEAVAELESIDGADERIAALEAERETRVRKLARDAKRLSRGRQTAATALGKEVAASLADLAMPHARFEVSLEPAAPPEGLPCGPTGLEQPEFVFSANRGEALRPLRQVASGGELSRAFLSIKQALRAGDGGMVLVFDEVDAGIGGEAADRVGQRLADLAADHQVLCITHLPQIAAYADFHFRVEKQERKGRTSVCIDRVQGPDRVEEIARMAAGDSAGKATRQFARELLRARAPGAG